jgi:hypothetical protein
MFRKWLSRRLQAAARLVSQRAPRVARRLRPAWWALDTRLGLTNYWGQRKHFEYYAEVARLARAHVPAGGSALDVGAADTELLRRLDWFARRVALDRRPPRPSPHVERVVGDFMDYRPPKPFDLVLCLQVLEHLEDPETFARKLLATGRRVIVSVPYRWPAGLSRGHVQDPVDEAKVIRWTGRAPVDTSIVRNGRDRLIAVFEGVAPD